MNCAVIELQGDGSRRPNAASRDLSMHANEYPCGVWANDIQRLPILLPVEPMHQTMHYGRENEARSHQEHQACVERKEPGK
jgi:hypothetical protein